MAQVEVVETTVPFTVVASERFFPTVEAAAETAYTVSTRLLIDYPIRFYVGYETGY